MSLFIGHIPCPKCGSKNNLGDYDDHQYCFGCQYYVHKTDTASLRARINRGETKQSDETLISTTKDIPLEAMQWLLKYNITPDEIRKYKIKWSNPSKVLVLIQTKTYWQGRNFGFGLQKYKSQGIKPLTVYGKGDTVILVEDVLSAIKIARTEEFAAVPVLGSSLSKEHEVKLIKRFNSIYVWLDRDKAKNAVQIKNRLRSKGITSRAIITPLDPKEYNKTEITQWLKS
jgi:hypothetical protein